MKLLALALATLLLAAWPALGRGPSHPPVPPAAQIRAAIGQAEHSRKLWATVNICNTPNHPDAVGIRGQMPGLGFATHLRMVFGIEVWDYARGGFKVLPGVLRSIDVGTQREGTWQSGVLLRFRSHTGLVRGRVTFEWLLGPRTIGRLQAVTRDGHLDARFGDPQGFSSWHCELP